MYPLSDNVWLIECPFQRPGGLIGKLLELLPTFPEEIRIQLEAVQDPLYSELGGLFLYPLLVYYTNTFYSERGYLICQYGIPLLSLYNLISATQLDASPDISFITFLRPEWEQGQPPKWVVEEWNALTEASKHHFRARFDNWGHIGLGTDFESLGQGCPWAQVLEYEFDVMSKRITPVYSGSPSWGRFPHLLVLPSLLPYDLTKKLIDAGPYLNDPTGEPLIRRLGHAITMWARAFDTAKEEDWDGGWMSEDDLNPALSNPDALIIYSTVVLEALFSSQGESEGATGRLADLTASCLGQSPVERFELARQLKKYYAFRSDVVHGRSERSAKHESAPIWLFKIATCALWQAVKLVIVDRSLTNWDQFNEFFQRPQVRCFMKHLLYIQGLLMLEQVLFSLGAGLWRK